MGQETAAGRRPPESVSPASSPYRWTLLQTLPKEHPASMASFNTLSYKLFLYPQCKDTQA